MKQKRTHNQRKQLHNKKITAVLFAAFLVISFVFISPFTPRIRSTYHSAQLIKKVERDDNTERTEYRDTKGRLVIAADLGYAVKTVIKNENSLTEKYFDHNEEPIRRYDGYYGVLREYNEAGNNTQNTYLDVDNNPVMTLSGYAIQKREYNENNQVTAISYYDTKGDPICTRAYGYSANYEYDDNGKVKISYKDIAGKPIITSQGYASLIREVYITDGPENGKTKKEFYYDENGTPVSLSLGQYGVYKEYNDLGQNDVIIYLDANGEPMVTNKGYTKVIRTFQANNSVVAEQYYDVEGKPFSLSEGQYGIRQAGRQTIYLNQDGQDQFNLKNFLYNHSWVVIPLSIVFIFFSALIDRRWNIIFMLIYIIVIAYLTLMFRENEEIKNTALLSYYRRIFTSGTARADILKNIWLFIPLGTMLYQLYPKKVILFIPIIMSIIIEGIQYITAIGFCELDDVISNGIGGWIGFTAGKMATNIKLSIVSWRQLHSDKEGHE